MMAERLPLRHATANGAANISARDIAYIGASSLFIAAAAAA